MMAAATNNAFGTEDEWDESRFFRYSKTPSVVRVLYTCNTHIFNTPTHPLTSRPEKQVVENLRQRIIPHPGSRLAELRAVDHSGMNALHYAAGRDAEGSFCTQKSEIECLEGQMAYPSCRLIQHQHRSDRPCVGTPARYGDNQ